MNMISRRSFLTGAAVASVSAALAIQGCAPVSSEEDVDSINGGSSEAERVDIVIVGGGLAGMMAAATLAEHYPEKNFVLLEQQNSLGGSLRFSDGYFVGFSERYNTDPADCATVEQMDAMIDAAAQDVIEHGYAVLDESRNESLSDGVFGEMPEVITELLDMGVPFQKPLDVNSPFSVGAYADDVYAVGTDDLGAGFSNAMVDHLTDKDVDVRVGVQVTELIVEDDVVVGVKTLEGSSEIDIRSNAVLLATGGFANSPEKLAEYLPTFKNCAFSPNPGATGMAIDFTRQFDTPLVSDGIFGGVVANDETFVITSSHFLVNEAGMRFADETMNWYLLLWAVAEHTESASGWCICDADYVAANPEETQPKLEAGSLVEYETIEALCQATGIDQAGLEATIQSYNASVDAGEAPEFGLPVDQANKIATAPFYAEQTTTFCFGTIKGLEIDESCRVLSGTGAPVPGLYATGETVVGNVIFGQYPSGGSGNSFSGNSGRYAARSIIETE